jgi:protease-4
MSPMREMTEEDERILKDMVWNVYNQFCSAVVESRNIPEEKVKEFADGRIFSGQQAFELGLVDEIGSFLGAVYAACGLAGIEPRKARLVYYRFRKGLFGGMRTSLRRIENLLPDADLRGIPLWMLPR